MPALITHDCFGRDVYDRIPKLIGSTTDQVDAFLLGSQGPDPLFFNVLSLNLRPFKDVAKLMHRQKTDELLLAFLEATCGSNTLAWPDKASEEIARAYALGFICHYLLDSAVHPLVYFYEFQLCDAGIEGLSRDDEHEVHALIESDLDEMMLFSRYNETVATFEPHTRLIHCSARVGQTVSSLYCHVVQAVYGIKLPRTIFTQAAHNFKRMHRLLYSPYNGKRAVLSRIELIARKKSAEHQNSLYDAMSLTAREHLTSDYDNRRHEAWSNPFTQEASCASFKDLYTAQLELAVIILPIFVRGEFNAASIAQITHGKNFYGQIN